MLNVFLLGEQVITDDANGDVRPNSSKTLALLTLLVVHAGRPQTRQRVSSALWPNSTDAQALTNLRRELHYLRQIVGNTGSLEITARHLCWRDSEACRVDVRVFEQNRSAALAAADVDPATGLAQSKAALAAYGGELLPGVYDDWLLTLREEEAQKCVELCDLACRLGRQLFDPLVAADAARRRIILRPLEEVGYRTLMTLQADLSDRSGAIGTYHRCASVLERELGVEPGPETRAMLQQIMAQETIGPHNRVATRDGRSGYAAGALVGRADELRQLSLLWQDPARERAQVILLRGDAGVGKTRLIAEFSTLAERQGAVVATARCFGTSGRLALAPVAEWLRHPGLRAATRQLEQVWRTEVERLVPSGEEPVDRPVGANAVADSWQRHRFFEALARAVTAPGRPTLLVLDNIQWCDPETLTFLAFLLSFAPRAPLLLAGTLRNERQADLELTRWANRIRTAGVLTELSVAPLDTANSRKLAERVSGRPLSDEGAAVLHAATGGFPLYVVEAARSPTEEKASHSNSDLSDVLQERFRQCSAPAREVVALAAAVGRDFTLDLLIEASELDADDVVHAVDELWQRRILVERSDGYDFSHDLLRETAYESISPPRRWLHHRRLGQSLELLHADALDDVAAELAEQYALGGRSEQAVHYYLRAARAAAEVFAYAEAIRLQRRAIALIATRSARVNRDSLELDCQGAMIAPLAAVYGYASAELQEASERCVLLAERLGRPRVAVNAMIALWVSRIVRGRLPDAQDLAGQALVRCEPVDNRWSHVQFICAGSAAMLARSSESIEYFRQAWEHPGGVDPLAVGARPDVQARSWAAHAYWLIGQPEEARSLTETAIGLARSIGQPFSLVVALSYAAITYQLAGDLPELHHTAAELQELIDRYSFPYFGEWGVITEGWGRGGAQGLAIALGGVNTLKSKGAFLRMPYWLSLIADLYRQTGRPEAARGTLDAALAGGQARSEVWWLPEVLRLRATYDAPGPAAARLRSAAQLARDHGSVALLERCEADLAALDRRPNGDVPAARTISERGLS